MNVNNVNDEQLIQRTLSGDQSAFGELVRQYQDRLYATMTHIAGSPEDALDVVQEAFLQAYLRLETFRSSSRFYTWLYRIAFNIAIGQRRKRRVMVSADIVPDDISRETGGDWGAPLRAAGNKEMHDILWKAIDRLDDDYRDAIVLREMEGCSYDEIATILDVPPGTVRSRLHRARNILRDLLNRHERDF